MADEPTHNLEKALILEAIRSRATDIHIDPQLDGYIVRFRVDGALRVIQTLDRAEGEKLVNQIKADVGIETGVVFHPVGVRRKWELGEESVDLRVTIVPCISGPKIAVRVLDLNQVERRLPKLGLGEHNQQRLERWSTELNGMILVTGPTASGKTTTVYALLHELANEARHVITIEDPVEYEIDGINQIQVDDRHELDFAAGIRASLRLDPDCLMVGEIRDSEAAVQAINAAVQGHVVLATMHSRDAASAVTRLRNMELADHQIAAALGVVVNQRLVRKLCPSCRDTRKPTEKERLFFEKRSVDAPEKVGVAVGCDECAGTGFHGRTGVFEVWNIEEQDYLGMLRGDDEQSLRQNRDHQDHRSLIEDAAEKVGSAMTSTEEIIRAGIDLPWNDS